ncbi:MAG: pirin family protein [Flavobacteriaceae bacterium]|nr:pirin family protein [Flavobacteriaceae bacterium]
MSVLIYKRQDQAKGNFNNGEILENKPIGFIQDGGDLKPYSNLFYWADAWTPGKSSIIGLHPHQGFEICSFIINGSIKHFDTNQNTWIELFKGDAQIIRSGNGISHAEEIMDNSEMFQIWFDPDISQTISKPSTYNDYKSNSFPTTRKNNSSIITIKGNGSPFEMDTEGVEIYNICFDDGSHSENIDTNKIYSLFVIKGTIIYEDKTYEMGTFIKIENESNFNFKAVDRLEVFKVSSPKRPSYLTYYERFN